MTLPLTGAGAVGLGKFLSLNFAAGIYRLNGVTYPDFATFLSASGSTFTRASAGYDLAATQAFLTNVARITSAGLTYEEARTNFQGNSDLKTGTDYSFVSGSVTDNGVDNTITAPDGTTGARKWTVVGDPSQARFGSTTGGTAGTTYDGSFWIKTADGGTYSGCTTDVNDNAAGGFAETPFTATPTWQRFASSGRNDTLNHRFLDVKLKPGVYHIFGAQIEAGATASSFIVTTAAPATRAVDALTLAVPAGLTTLTVTFDDNSTQTINSATGSYLLPTNINRPTVKSLVWGT